jgi:hypothetical protein
LDPHDHAHQDADQEKPERRDQVQVAYDFVVGRGEPAGQDRPFAAVLLEGLLLDRLLDGGHGLMHPLLTSAANAAGR